MWLKFLYYSKGIKTIYTVIVNFTFLVFPWFIAITIIIARIHYAFLFLIQSVETVCMIRHIMKLPFDTFDLSTQSMKKWPKEFFSSFICFITNHTFYNLQSLLLIECSWWFSLQFFVDIKLIFIVKWIFHAPDILRSSIIQVKNGLIFPRYSYIDSVLFPSPLLLHLITLSLNAP